MNSLIGLKICAIATAIKKYTSIIKKKKKKHDKIVFLAKSIIKKKKKHDKIVFLANTKLNRIA